MHQKWSWDAKMCPHIPTAFRMVHRGGKGNISTLLGGGGKLYLCTSTLDILTVWSWHSVPKRNGKYAILSTGFPQTHTTKCFATVESSTLDVHVHTYNSLPSNVHIHKCCLNRVLVHMWPTTYLSSEVAVLIEAGLFYRKNTKCINTTTEVSLDPPNLLTYMYMDTYRNWIHIHVQYYTCFPHIPMSFGAIWTSVVNRR